MLSLSLSRYYLCIISRARDSLSSAYTNLFSTLPGIASKVYELLLTLFFSISSFYFPPRGGELFRHTSVGKCFQTRYCCCCCIFTKVCIFRIQLILRGVGLYILFFIEIRATMGFCCERSLKRISKSTASLYSFSILQKAFFQNYCLKTRSIDKALPGNRRDGPALYALESKIP